MPRAAAAETRQGALGGGEWKVGPCGEADGDGVSRGSEAPGRKGGERGSEIDAFAARGRLSHGTRERDEVGADGGRPHGSRAEGTKGAASRARRRRPEISGGGSAGMTARGTRLVRAGIGLGTSGG